MDAQNVPVRRTKQVAHTADMEINQRSSVELIDGEDIDHENIVIAEASVMDDGLKQLAFMEEIVEIMIERTAEKNPPKVVDCWVNGRGAEVLGKSGWMVLGFLPVGIPVRTKRKYVEVMARSKIDNITTTHGDANDETPANTIDISTSSKAPFSVLHDANPLGREWLTRLMRQQG